ncbi:rhodanese-like domain-containing protein [Methanobrevibacter sp. DSM 116169]|uniref:rhodanese-like domain-containing protein n=1 Tax=Methanobrevibacter sp. DSM 116169 TaxID=3242727 RepID=UPI0038FC6F19
MDFTLLSPEDAHNMLNEDKNILLIDVRSNEEYNEGHIAGSISMPLDVIDEDILREVGDKNKKILLYCKSGRRSKIAAEKLRDLGYTNIFVLDGGINNWNYGLSSN